MCWSHHTEQTTFCASVCGDSPSGKSFIFLFVIDPPLKPLHSPQPSAAASSQSVLWRNSHKEFCDMTVTDAGYEAL